MTDTPNDKIIKQLIEGACQGGVDRRRFMEGALFTGMGVAAASSLWAGKVAAQTPQRGGTYRFGCHDANTTDSYDPGTTESVYMIQLNHAFRNFLTEIAANGSVVGDAAISWSASDDASEWRFELSPDMVFHSGKPFTARDAVASLNHHRGEDSTSAAKALLQSVVDIQPDGDHAIVITLDGGNADLPYLLTDYHLVMLPSDDMGNVDWQSGDGAGPYRIVNHEPGVSTEMVRHDGYHREGLAHFDAVNMIALNDPNARQSAILTGDVDALSEIDVRTADLMARNPRIKMVEVASGTHPTIPMHVNVDPFTSNDVRMALKYAINREDMVEKLLFGRGSVGNDNPIAPGMPFYHEMPQREYDPERAKFHLQRAGLDSLSLMLATSEAAYAAAVDTAVLYREHAAPAGIDITVDRKPPDAYWSDVWLKNPFMVVSWGARPTPDVMFSLAYQAGAAWNESNWENERFNELLVAARAELDQDRRAAMYAEMQELVRDEGGTIVPFFRNRVNVMAANVGTPDQMAGNWEADGARSFQRWWFNS
jgi:peptide/nickel transport system substrate-binding protein